MDLLHEVELGVWKGLLIHLFRILEAADENHLHEVDKRYAVSSTIIYNPNDTLNSRFRLVPTFGGGTIRRFSRNSSELKGMAAWNYEDLLQVSISLIDEFKCLTYFPSQLQCAIPVFEGLLPEPHNTRILQLLFQFAHWHGIAKLRVHSDVTLPILDKETTNLGDKLRAFRSKTCSEFDTRELRREARARKRRQAKAGPAIDQDSARKVKTFNLNTYKTHSLGDYYEMISRLGTTDSYSTEPVCRFRVSSHWVCSISIQGELEHRTPKGRYKRTSKKAFKTQLVQIERRQARIRRIHDKVAVATESLTENSHGTTGTLPGVSLGSDESIANDPAMHHHIGKAENVPVHIGAFLRSHATDPAITV